MSRLSGHAEVVQDAADKISNDSTAIQSISAGIAAAAAAVTDLRDALGGNEEPSAMQPGTGADGMDLYESTVVRNDSADLFYTSVIMDIDGLASAATNDDIIGETGGTANAHVGQYTLAELGTLIGARVTCLQTPAGGEVDLNLSAADESTLAQGALISSGTNNTTLVDRSGDWAAGDVRVFSNLPAADQYLYWNVGTASSPTGGTYTAGIFLVEFWGHTA